MAEEKQKNKKTSKEEKFAAGAPTRGRTFEGTIVKKFASRAVIEFERTVYVIKYERFYKKKTRIHAIIPKDIELKVGDHVLAMECRPISKLIHFVVIALISKSEKGGAQ